MTFRMPIVATIRIIGITQCDSDQWTKGICVAESLLPVVDLSPLVMAIWSQWAI
jgi:hypothetical protein